MFRKSLILIVVLALALAACQPAPAPAPTQAPVDMQATIDAVVAATVAAQPEPTQLPTDLPEPTQAPAPTEIPAPTEAPQPAVVVVEAEAGPVSYRPAMTGVFWQWVSSLENGQFTVVSDPSRYEVQFMVDGSVSIRADCNTVIGSYTISEGDQISIVLGASTLVACPEGSQSDQFLAQLASVAAFEFVDGNLSLRSSDGGMVMTFNTLPVAILPPPAAGEPSATSTTNVNVRSGPGENYIIFGVLPFGSTVRIVGKNAEGTWWAFNMPISSTGVGWSSASFFSVTNAENVPVLPTPPAPESVALPAPQAGDPQATVISPVFLRMGPGDAYPVYGQVQPGATGLVIGRSQDGLYWLVRVDPARIRSGSAWVMASLTSAQNVANVPAIVAPPVPSTAELPPPPEGAPAATATVAVNVRTGPSTEYPVLGVAPQGRGGQVLGRSEDGRWWQVRVSTALAADGLGWVSGDFVIATNTENVPFVAAPPLPPPVTAPPASGQNLVQTTEPLNVRSGPHNSFPSYGQIPAGTILQVVGASGNWLECVFPSLPGGVGWISGNYVVPFSP